MSKKRSKSPPHDGNSWHLHWLPVTARIHFKIALLTFKSLHHSSIISVIPHSTLCSFACPPLFQCSASLCPYSAHRVLDRPVQQSGIPYHFQLLSAPPFILSRNSAIVFRWERLHVIKLNVTFVHYGIYNFLLG